MRAGRHRSGCFPRLPVGRRFRRLCCLLLLRRLSKREWKRPQDRYETIRVERERIKWKDPMGSDSGLKKKSRKTRRTMTVPVPARHLATDDDLFFRRPAEEAAAAVVLNDFGSRVLAADAATESIMVCGRPQ